ncbi:MAG: carboxypeptidase-like regulatory domain-containing protein [Planctomycetes bacterium]|nr:carboxypeptidase-like regulatory domain-containing protein [Planctomycetota bacterium]
MASSQQEPTVDEHPRRRPATRAFDPAEKDPDGISDSAARVTGRVVRIDKEAFPASAFWFRLFGNALEGGAEGRGETLDFKVKGGVGRFEWALLAPGWEPATGIVDVLGGETASIGVVRLVPATAILEGCVLDAGGRPVEGATVWLHGLVFRPSFPFGSTAGLEREGRTDPAGRFRFERLRAGDRFVEVQAENLPPIPAVAGDTLSAGGLRRLQISPSVGAVSLRVRGEWSRPFHLVLTDDVRRIVVDWPIVPPGWSRDPGRMRSGPWLGCGMREFQVIELRPAPGGRGLLPPVDRPWVTRGREVAEVQPGGDGATVLIRDVPASPHWRAEVRRPDARGVEPAEFELVPGGHVVLDVQMK